jgi:hypothetical protein
MLARTEEAVYSGQVNRATVRMNAIETLLTGLIDYAGLYPPASLDMKSAVSNYLAYKRGKHAYALGRFIVDLDRIDELRAAAGKDIREFRLSVIGSPGSNWREVSIRLEEGLPIGAIEARAICLADIERVFWDVPRHLERYLEVPVCDPRRPFAETIANIGVRVKVRMGGVVAEAFPSSESVAEMLATLGRLRIPFKATAGLHHPIRSRHRFSYAHNSPDGIMHGFLNLSCAAAHTYFGGDVSQAKSILDEQDTGAWRLTDQQLAWRNQSWNCEQLNELRAKFFISFGSCSFEEPLSDLEAMGWL